MHYLNNLTKLRTVNRVEELYGDYFSTYLSNTVAQLRIQLNITLTSTPPYMHHLNPYAEGLMRILKTGVIRRLPNLRGCVIHNKVVVDGTAESQTL